MTAFAGFCQSSDTVCVDRKQLVKAIEQGLKAGVYKEQITALQKDKDTLLQLIELREQMISNLAAQGEIYKELISTYKKELSELTAVRAILDGQISALQKQIKKERRKKKWATIVGIAAVATLGTLYILK